MQKGGNKAFQGEQRLHYKMYKSGKRWLLAGIASAALFSITFVTQNNVKAATANDGEPTSTITQQLDAQTNENTASTTQSDNAVKTTEPDKTTQKTQQTQSAEAATQTAQQDASSSARETATTAATTTSANEAQSQATADTVSTQSTVLHVQAKLDDTGKASVTITGPANTNVGVTDSQGRAVVTLRLDDQGTTVWQTRASGALTFSAVGAQALTTTAVVPAASASQNEQAAVGAAQLHTNNRDAIVSGSLAEHSQTQLDTNNIDPGDFVKSNQVGFGGEFSNLIDESKGLDDVGDGERNGDPVQLATKDDSVQVNVVTTDSTLVSGSMLGTSNTYDVIQLQDGISAQITEQNGKKVALVTAKILPSISDLVPFYDLLELAVNNPITSTFTLGFNSILVDALKGLKDSTTISTLVPVTPVGDPLPNGDYSKFVVDLSGINVVQLVEDKLESVIKSADTDGSLASYVSENGTSGTIANAVQGIGSASLLGKTVVVTPLTVHATKDINSTTDPQDISIASAFYTNNVFEFDFGTNPDENYYPLQIQLADKDGNGIADITETGETEPSTGTETGTHTGTGTGTSNTTPTSLKLAGTAEIEEGGEVLVSGTGAKAGDDVWVISGSGYADADVATRTGHILGTGTAAADGSALITVTADKARAYYGTTVTLLDRQEAVIVPVDVPADTASAVITGTLVVKYNGTAPKPSQADHAGDSIWSQIVANYGTNKLTVKVTAGKQTLDVVLPDVSDFTWEPGATGFGMRVHTGDFQLTAAGKALVTAAVTAKYPSAEFDVDAIPYGGDLDIQPGELGLTLNGTIALDTPATSLPSTYQGSLSVQAKNADGSNHGAPIELVSGDFALADGVTPTDGVHQNAFVLTASGLAKLTTALGEQGGYNITTAAAGGTLAVASSVTRTYTVHYEGAGVLTPEDYPQTISWTESFAADGTPTWTPDETLLPVATPEIKGFKANYSSAYNNGLEASSQEPQASTEKITYTFLKPTGTILPDDQFVPVSGETAQNAQVTLTTSTGGGVIVTADNNGSYEAIVTRGAAPAGSKLTVTATVADGNDGKITSPSLELAVQEAPDAPVATITPVKRGTATVTGTAESRATIEFTVDNESVGSAVATDSGSFSITLDVKKVPVGSKVMMTQTTAAGTSKATSVVVNRPDLNAPSAQVVLVAPTMEGNID